MNLYLEIYFTSIVGDFLYYDQDLIGIMTATQDPDQILHEHIRSKQESVFDANNFILTHVNTRHEFLNSNHSIILSYFVYSEEMNVRKYFRIPITVLENRSTPDISPQKPTDVSYEGLDILRQGVARLADLARGEQREEYQKLITPESVSKMSGFISK